MKKLLALVLALLMLATLLVACGDEETGGENLKDYLQNEEMADYVTLESGETYYFKQDDSESVIITAYECSNNEKRDLVIPATITVEKGDTGEFKTYTVVGIGEEAFKANNDIISITIPETVRTIGDFAFAQCSQVVSVTIPAGVTSIGKYAFTRCHALKTLDIKSEAVDEIKEFTFYECTSLTELTVAGTIKTIGTGAFYGCSSIKTIVIEEGVEEIGRQAFQNCTVLESLSLPASLTKIGKQAFNGSKALYDDAVIYAEGATVAREHFEKQEHMLPERDNGEDGDTVIDTENKNYKILTSGGFKFACPIEWKKTSYKNAEVYKDSESGNYLYVSVKNNDSESELYKNMTPALFEQEIQPNWELLGVQVSNVEVNSVKNKNDLTVVTVQMTNIVGGVEAVQTLVVYVGEAKTVQILVTEVVADAELVSTVVDSIAIA